MYKRQNQSEIKSYVDSSDMTNALNTDGCQIVDNFESSVDVTMKSKNLIYTSMGTRLEDESWRISEEASQDEMQEILTKH